MYKPRSRKQLYTALLISPSTLNRWIKPLLPRLLPLGYRHTNTLTPAMLHIIYTHLCIDPHELFPDE